MYISRYFFPSLVFLFLQSTKYFAGLLHISKDITYQHYYLATKSLSTHNFNFSGNILYFTAKPGNSKSGIIRLLTHPKLGFQYVIATLFQTSLHSPQKQLQVIVILVTLCRVDIFSLLHITEICCVARHLLDILIFQ